MAGADGAWDDGDVANPDIKWDAPNNRFVMNYSGNDPNVWKTGLAYSTDLTTWTKEATNPVFFDAASLSCNGSIAYKDGTYYLYYQDDPPAILLATSTDQLTWTPQNSGNPVVPVGAVGEWDEDGTFDPMVRMNGSTFEMFYCGRDLSGNRGIGRATSTDGVTWTKAGRLFDFAGLGSACGEPSVLFTDPDKYMIFTDIGSASRSIRCGWTLDGGLNWQFQTVLTGSGSGWDSNQVFDSFPVWYDGNIYLFYAGAPNEGSVSGMDADIGYAVAPWPENKLV